MSLKSSPLLELLEELLHLHEAEREHMEALRHTEHLQCLAQKLQCAQHVEKLVQSLSKLSESEKALTLRIKNQALINADIAQRMLHQTKNKIDFINKLCSPSYGSNGRMQQSHQHGGLFDLSA